MATIAEHSRSILEAAWVDDPGYTAPNPHRYPWQWLWDSCFHAIVWSGLGDARALTEMRSLFGLQLPGGFLPNMGFQRDPTAALRMWRHRGRSDITQPPMYGHALRVLAERGVDVSELLEPAARAMRWLFDTRLDPVSGLLRIVHPWESGCDDSPRWDGWISHHYSRAGFALRKWFLVRSLRLRDGAASSNPLFEVCPASFNALVAFNARELAELTGDTDLRIRADRLVDALERTWDADRVTWVDIAARGHQRPSSAVRTLDALLPLLVSGDPGHLEAAWRAVFDPHQFWRSHGPSTVAANEPAYQPDQYWRGPAWPQLIYLLRIAAQRQGHGVTAARLGAALVRGAERSGFAELWDPETGRGLGAIPQGWTTLAAEVAPRLQLRMPASARSSPHSGVAVAD